MSTTAAKTNIPGGQQRRNMLVPTYRAELTQTGYARAKWPADVIARRPLANRLMPSCLPPDRWVGRRGAREHLVFTRLLTREHELAGREIAIAEHTHLGTVEAHVLHLGRRADAALHQRVHD